MQKIIYYLSFLIFFQFQSNISNSEVKKSNINISPKEAAKIMTEKPHTAIIVDVRNGAEYDQESILGSVLINQYKLIDEYKDNRNDFLSKYEVIILHCQSGVRGLDTANKIRKLANKNNITIYNLDGGINAWREAGLPTIKKGGIPIMRQVQIVVGIMLVIFGLVAYFKNKKAIILTIFIGAGLLFAGLTGSCALGRLISMMPWN